jgi:hypothetical protein
MGEWRKDVEKENPDNMDEGRPRPQGKWSGPERRDVDEASGWLCSQQQLDLQFDSLFFSGHN